MAGSRPRGDTHGSADGKSCPCPQAFRPDGSLRRIQRSIVIGLLSEVPTRREAQIQLDQHLHILNQGQQRPQATKHLQDFVECEWTTLVLSTLKLSTQRGYRMVLGKRVLPCFGQRRLCDITKLDIQQFVADKFRQGLAWQTVRNAWIILSSVVDAAVDYSYLNSNPARGVKFPLQGLRKGPRILNSEALGKLLAQLREPYRSMVMLAASTGLRVGELLALRWKVVDLTVGTIRVSESVFHDQVQLPKCERSIRTIPIGPQNAHSWKSIARGSPPNGTRKAYSSRTSWADCTARVIFWNAC